MKWKSGVWLFGLTVLSKPFAITWGQCFSWDSCTNWTKRISQKKHMCFMQVWHYCFTQLLPALRAEVMQLWRNAAQGCVETWKIYMTLQDLKLNMCSLTSASLASGFLQHMTSHMLSSWNPTMSLSLWLRLWLRLMLLGCVPPIVVNDLGFFPS